jgi:putative phage-type endonuclease
MKQRTSAWFEARLGKATASHMGDIMTKTRSGSYGTGGLNYMTALLCERLTGEVAEYYVSGPMQWGIDQEPYANSEYELRTDSMVLAEGFVDHPTIPMSGASPDGLVDDDGLIEIKCPNTATHIKHLLGESIKPEYMLQMQWQLDCTGRAWCDFVSYDPRLPENLQMVITRVDRDEDLIAEIRQEVVSFLSDLEKLEGKLRDRMTRPAGSEQIETGGTAEPAVTKLKEGEIF